jgi:hypothetical protein
VTAGRLDVATSKLWINKKKGGYGIGGGRVVDGVRSNCDWREVRVFKVERLARESIFGCIDPPPLTQKLSLLRLSDNDITIYNSEVSTYAGFPQLSSVHHVSLRRTLRSLGLLLRMSVMQQSVVQRHEISLHRQLFTV